MTFNRLGFFRTIPYLVLLLFIGACGGSSESVADMTSEERFRLGMEAIEDEDYIKARELLETIVLQDPAGDLADDAQFWVGESYFLDEEYHNAAFAYGRLLQLFPSTSYYKQALFKMGEALTRVAPRYDRDQETTRDAIVRLRAFVDYFPSDSLATVARTYITDLRSKLAQREYLIAQFYIRQDEYRAATIYLQRVIDEYSDTQYYQQAVADLQEIRAKLPPDDERTDKGTGKDAQTNVR